MALQRIVVVPKPLEALPPMLAPAADDPESLAIAKRLEVARSEHAQSLAEMRALVADDPSITWLETPTAESLEGAALAVTVGGDGTLTGGGAIFPRRLKSIGRSNRTCMMWHATYESFC